MSDWKTTERATLTIRELTLSSGYPALKLTFPNNYDADQAMMYMSRGKAERPLEYRLEKVETETAVVEGTGEEE